MWSRGSISPSCDVKYSTREMQVANLPNLSGVAVRKRNREFLIEHNYMTDLCNNEDDAIGINTPVDLELPKSVAKNGWKEGRRVMFRVLLSKLRYCQKSRLGRSSTYDNVIGELKKGLGGYLYVVCQNCDCQYVNRVPYGKTHHQQSTGMPCFAVNTKLGTGNWP